MLEPRPSVVTLYTVCALPFAVKIGGLAISPGRLPLSRVQGSDTEFESMKESLPEDENSRSLLKTTFEFCPIGVFLVLFAFYYYFLVAKTVAEGIVDFLVKSVIVFYVFSRASILSTAFS